MALTFRCDGTGDKKLVTIRRAGSDERKCTVPCATVLALLHDPRLQPPPADQHMLLSVVVRTPTSAPALLINLKPTGIGRRTRSPTWPRDWHPEPPPLYQRAVVRFGEWVRLPQAGQPCDALLADHREALRLRDNQRSTEIETRCQEIKAHASDEAFEESLDYYTTLRVKLAYLRMNQAGIAERLRQTQICLQDIVRRLLKAPDEFHEWWDGPEGQARIKQLTEATPLDDALTSDPNALTCPQPGDYVLLVTQPLPDEDASAP